MQNMSNNDQYSGQLPAWYWTGGLHDAVVRSVTEKENCLEICLDSANGMLERDIRKISLFNCKIQTLEVQLLIILVMVLAVSLIGCGFKRFPTIDAEQVEKISVWCHDGRRDLNADEAARFIRLYNASKYAGEGTEAVGTTPAFGVDVYFFDGSVLAVNDFQCTGEDFEVYMFRQDQRLAWCYVDNQALLQFLLEDLDIVQEYKKW